MNAYNFQGRNCGENYFKEKLVNMHHIPIGLCDANEPFPSK